MNDTVSLRFQDDVAVITINNPPVNAVSASVRTGVVDSIKALKLSDAKAVVLCCAGRTFVAGADIREFNQTPKEPHLPDVVQVLEDCPLPIVAAIHGTALGGGLELALGCHYRVALASARLGMPEVNLGLIPGAGGTQRLPRLIGVKAAADMITSGQMVSAQVALQSGLLDQVFDERLEEHAIAFARSVTGKSFTPISQLEVDSNSIDETWIEQQKKRLEKRGRGQQSPLVALESVIESTRVEFSAGMKRERELFVECKASEQSTALRHIFFAERATTSGMEFIKSKARGVTQVGVIGAGTMGAGIALCFANAGIPVVLIELNDKNLQRGLDTVNRSLDKAVELGKINQEARDHRSSLVVGSTEYSALCDADVVIEAAFESLEVKHDIFRLLGKHCRADAVLATNTSYLDVDMIAAVVANPARVVGMHFFSPADRMKLLEVVHARETSEETLATAITLGKRIGKIAVPVGVCFGFAANRSYAAYGGAVQELLLSGSTPAQIDQAMRSWGMAMGPCAVLDLSGIDIGYKARKEHPDPPDDPAWFAASNALAEAGLFGRKSGAGFYLYEEKVPVENPQALELIRATAERLGVSQVEQSEHQIQNAIAAALASEGRQIITEGIVRKASDMDVIWVNGYGFPRWRGGPMFAAGIINS